MEEIAAKTTKIGPTATILEEAQEAKAEAVSEAAELQLGRKGCA